MIYFLIAAIVVVGGGLLVIKWSLDVSESAIDREREDLKGVHYTGDGCGDARTPVSAQPAPPPKKKTYIDHVLEGHYGPSSIPGGMDEDTERRYSKLVGTADHLERCARDHARGGDMDYAHRNAGMAKAMRGAAARLRSGEEPVAASDSLVTTERERELDNNVREARDATRRALETDGLPKAVRDDKSG